MGEENEIKVLALDLGYSAIKACYTDLEGVLQYEKFISAVAKFPEKPLEIDNDVMFQVNGEYYIIGEAALHVPKSYLIEIVDYKSMKACYPILVSFLLQRYKTYGLSFDKVAVGLSMAFNQYADDLLSYLYETLMINPSTNYFLCLPQGLSCKASYNEMGLSLQEKSSKTKMNSYILLDGGMLTCDFANIASSGTTAGSCIGVEGSGVINIVNNLSDYIYKTYEFRLSNREVQKIIEDSPQGQFERRGRRYDVTEPMDKICKKYLADVLNLLENKLGEAIDAVDGILVCGGVSYIFRKYMNEPDMKAEIERHFPLSFLKLTESLSEYYNCDSYLRIVQKLAREGRIK
jgi:uncharacterized protein (UPF0297 family)